MSKKYKEDNYATFYFTDSLMEILNIPKIKKIDDYDELWTYVKFDKHTKLNAKKLYLISTYGRVYSIRKKALLKPANSVPNNKGEYYKTIEINIQGISFNYFIHRMIMVSFIGIDESRPFVNHIDGHPSNNYIWNLEWCTASENSIHAIRTGLKIDKRGQDRSNALWKDDEIRIICKLMEEGHKATYIYNVLGDILKDSKVTYERVRTLYKHIIHQTHWTHISKDYNIDFTRFNYTKEKGSVAKLNNK